jgi:large subunit ribosomal protein L21e
MVKRQGGFRSGTRSKLSKGKRVRGKISQRKFFQTLNIGDRVKLTAEPAHQKAMYFPRYHGLVGIVKGKQGNCYNVSINDHKKEKVLIVHPVHLTKLKQ